MKDSTCFLKDIINGGRSLHFKVLVSTLKELAKTRYIKKMIFKVVQEYPNKKSSMRILQDFIETVAI